MRVGEEQRQSARKVLRTKALLRIDGEEPFIARTLDVGTNGVGVSCQQQLKAGQSGQVSFEFYANGKTNTVTSRVKVMYCIYCSKDGFKVGLQFINLDLASAATITKFMI